MHKTLDEIFLELDKTIYNLNQKFKKIYIYGAGIVGQQIQELLYEKECSVDAFIVSKKSCTSSIKGIPILSLSEYLNISDEKSIILIAMNRHNRDNLFNTYEKLFQEKKLNIFEFDETIIRLLSFYHMNKKIDIWKKNFPTTSTISLQNWKNILVLHVEDAIGDTIWGSSFLRELRQNFPKAHITYIVNHTLQDIVKNCPYVNEIIGYDYKPQMYSIELEEKVNSFVNKNLSQSYDAVFLVKALPTHGSDAIDNVLLALYSSAKVRISHSFNVFKEEKMLSEFWKSLFPIMSLNSKAEHDVSKDLSLLKICNLDVKNENMELWPGKDDVKYAKELLKNYKNYYLIALGPNGREKRRNWPAEKYLELTNELTQIRRHNLCYIIFGGDNTINTAKIIKQSNAKIIDIAGKTSLSQSIAIMGECNMYVGADTSLMHMAAAFGHPCIELTANLKDGIDTDRSSPVRTGPWKVPFKVIYPAQNLDDCSHICLKPYAHCITQIKVHEVIYAMKKLFEETQEKSTI